MKKFCSTLALVASTLFIIFGFASPAAGATPSVWPASALATSQISLTQGPCPAIVGCGPGPACLFVGDCKAPCQYSCVDPNNKNFVKDPTFFGQGERNNPNNPPSGSGTQYSGGGGGW